MPSMTIDFFYVLSHSCSRNAMPPADGRRDMLLLDVKSKPMVWSTISPVVSVVQANIKPWLYHLMVTNYIFYSNAFLPFFIQFHVCFSFEYVTKSKVTGTVSEWTSNFFWVYRIQTEHNHPLKR